MIAKTTSTDWGFWENISVNEVKKIWSDADREALGANSDWLIPDGFAEWKLLKNDTEEENICIAELKKIWSKVGKTLLKEILAEREKRGINTSIYLLLKMYVNIRKMDYEMMQVSAHTRFCNELAEDKKMNDQICEYHRKLKKAKMDALKLSSN